MTDAVWSDRYVRVNFTVTLPTPAKAKSWRETVYFVETLYVTVTYFPDDDKESVAYKGKAYRAKADGTPSKRSMEFNQYTFTVEPEEIASIVEEAKRRARRHWS